MASSPSASPSESASASPSTSPSTSASASPSTSASTSPSASPSTSASGSPSSSPSASTSVGAYSEQTVVGGNVSARSGTGLCAVTGTFEMSEALVYDDVIHMVKIPAGATVLEVILSAPDLDSGTDVLLSVGYTDALTAFISGSDIAQTGGIARTSSTGVLFAAEDTIQVSVDAGTTTETEGTIRLTVIYTFDP